MARTCACAIGGAFPEPLGRRAAAPGAADDLRPLPASGAVVQVPASGAVVQVPASGAVVQVPASGAGAGQWWIKSKKPG